MSEPNHNKRTDPLVDPTEADEYSYMDSDEEGPKNDGGSTGDLDLNVGDIQEEAGVPMAEETTEDSEEESDDDDSEDDDEAQPQAVAFKLPEYEPSINRGPGALDYQEAGRIRNRVSNISTANKKQKVMKDASVNTGARANELVEHMMGQAGSTMMMLRCRNLYSKKGCDPGDSTQLTINKMYGGEAKATETAGIVQELAPKYGSGDGKAIGTNKSPPVKLDDAICKGFQSELQDVNLPPTRSKNCAMLGVNFVRQMAQKLRNGKNGVDPTENELLAACNYSVFLATKKGNKDITAETKDQLYLLNNDYDYKPKISEWED